MMSNRAVWDVSLTEPTGNIGLERSPHLRYLLSIVDHDFPVVNYRCSLMLTQLFGGEDLQVSSIVYPNDSGHTLGPPPEWTYDIDSPEADQGGIVLHQFRNHRPTTVRLQSTGGHRPTASVTQAMTETEPYSKSLEVRMEKPGARARACSGRSGVRISSGLLNTGQSVAPSTETSRPPGLVTRISSLMKLAQSRTWVSALIYDKIQTYPSHQRSAVNDVEGIIRTRYTLNDVA